MGQTKYETVHGLVSRVELRTKILGMFDELDDHNFHQLYSILWSMSVKDLLIKCKEDEIKRLERDIKSLEKED